MRRKFSPALISQCQRIFSKKAGFPISEDQAELYLEKFARLMMLAVKVLEREEETKKANKKIYGQNNSN